MRRTFLMHAELFFLLVNFLFICQPAAPQCSFSAAWRPLEFLRIKFRPAEVQIRALSACGARLLRIQIGN